MIRIGFIGGPDAGKSTQAAHLYSVMKSRRLLVELVREYAREAINSRIYPVEKLPWNQYSIYQEQKNREDILPYKLEYMVTDSPLLLSYVYTMEYALLPDDKQVVLDSYSKFLDDAYRYDYLFFPDRPSDFQDDGTRKQDRNRAIKIDYRIRGLLDTHNVPYNDLSGNMEEQTKQALEIMRL